MIGKSGNGFDIILITAEYYEDHPYSPAGVIAKVLDAKGFSVGIIEKPQTNDDFKKLGNPKLCFCVTSGSIDSMLNNYTPLKKKRAEDEYSKITRMPDRAVTVYCNKLRELFKPCTIVLGGIEASLRRFAHYDYWDNKIRKSILLDTRADILVYGNGEKQIIEIAENLRDKKAINKISGTCTVSRELPDSFELIPSFEELKEDNETSKKKFCEAQLRLSNNRDLAQKYDNNYVLQHKFPKYTREDLDWIYGLDYSRKLRPGSLLKLAQFSVQTHRGCIGKCSFCSIALHQGDKIISRSKDSLLKELERIASHPDFKGTIDDLGGPSANMFGMDCKSFYECSKSCIMCDRLDRSHKKIIELLKEARAIKGIKKIFIRSGIRYDLALNSKEYIDEVSAHHISGCLKIAPEHTSENVLKLMNKNSGVSLNSFIGYFNSINQEKNQQLRYYFMVGHPGDNPEETRKLEIDIKRLRNVEQFQLFTPTPMTLSTCMYYTGMDPKTLEKIDVVYDYNTKKQMKRIILNSLAGTMDRKPQLSKKHLLKKYQNSNRMRSEKYRK